MSDAALTAEAADTLGEHRQHSGHGEMNRHDRLISIVEAVLLSLVALVAAWSGYCAASWDTRSSDLLTQSLELQVQGQAAAQEGLQIRTFDGVAFDAAFDAYVAKDRPAFRLAIRRLRPEYQKAFDAWLATKPATNPNAPADPSKMPQYRIPQEIRGRALAAKAKASFRQAVDAGNTSDKYVRITVILATVLFLIGISGHFPVRIARYALIGIGTVLILYSVVALAGLPGPPG